MFCQWSGQHNPRSPPQAFILKIASGSTSCKCHFRTTNKQIFRPVRQGDAGGTGYIVHHRSFNEFEQAQTERNSFKSVSICFMEWPEICVRVLPKQKLPAMPANKIPYPFQLTSANYFDSIPSLVRGYEKARDVVLERASRNRPESAPLRYVPGIIRLGRTSVHARGSPNRSVMNRPESTPNYVTTSRASMTLAHSARPTRTYQTIRNRQ